jgi:predicted phage terminase large subunit-like protein
MSNTTPAELQGILRSDFTAFVEKTFQWVSPNDAFEHATHIDLIATRVAEARHRRLRLIVNLPPRSLKSIIVSVALPAWLLGHNPKLRIIVVSYADALGGEHARACRLVMRSPWYRALFPRTRIAKDSELDLVTTARGQRITTSIGGTLTGRGGHLMIIDDPMKAADAESELARAKVKDWFNGTAFSRLDDKEAGSFIVVMQRLHQDDLSGHLLEGGDFEHLRLPAIATEPERIEIRPGVFHVREEGAPLTPARESLATLQVLKQRLGSHNWAAQYQQDPAPPEGNLFKPEWIPRAEPAPWFVFPHRVQSWDIAAKVGAGNDYSVCLTFGIHENHYFLLDVHRGRWEFPELRKQVLEQHKTWSPREILVEDASSGQALLQVLQRETRLNAIGIKPQLDKYTRAAQQSAAVEAGRLVLPREQTWLAEFQRELFGFPSAKHDDQVDALV